MERYSKASSSSKFKNRYNEEFKTFILEEFLTGTLKQKSLIEQKF